MDVYKVRVGWNDVNRTIDIVELGGTDSHEAVSTNGENNSVTDAQEASKVCFVQDNA